MRTHGESSSRRSRTTLILASQGISFYRQLYDVEERAKTLDAAARRELRQRDAVPIWNRMEQWLASDAANRALPSSAIGKSLGYLRNQWTALRRYLSDGNIPIDNDQSERIIRPLVVGRGNWLFLGHPDAAPGRMQMYSVVSSAHRHHLVIEDYLEDVLRKLADAEQHHPADLALDSPYLLDLLPDRWALTHPKSVRNGRIEEREDVLDAKRLRRAAPASRPAPPKRPVPRRWPRVCPPAPPFCPRRRYPRVFGTCSPRGCKCPRKTNPPRPRLGLSGGQGGRLGWGFSALGGSWGRRGGALGWRQFTFTMGSEYLAETGRGFPRKPLGGLLGPIEGLGYHFPILNLAFRLLHHALDADRLAALMLARVGGFHEGQDFQGFLLR